MQVTLVKPWRERRTRLTRGRPGWAEAARCWARPRVAWTGQAVRQGMACQRTGSWQPGRGSWMASSRSYRADSSGLGALVAASRQPWQPS